MEINFSQDFTPDLPDALRVPLHETQADIRYNFGRVALDSSLAGMMADHVLSKLSQVETACYQINAELAAARKEMQQVREILAGVRILSLQMIIR